MRILTLGVILGIAIAACGSSGTTFDNSSSGGASTSQPGNGPGFGSSGSSGKNCSDPNRGDLQGCSCSGSSRACFTVDPASRNRNGCKDGAQACVKNGEFSAWGPCTGEVTSCVSTGGSLGGNSSGKDAGAGNGGGGNEPSKDGGAGNGGGGNEDAGPQGLNVGAACTPGDVKQGPAGAYGCQDVGTPSIVLYCESGGKWACFPADNCSPSACAACMQSNGCGDVINTTSSAQCKSNLRSAYSWLTGCGPDRSAYFEHFNDGCTNNELFTMNACKQTHCTQDNGGPCSFY